MTCTCAWIVIMISWWLTIGFISNQWQIMLWYKRWGSVEYRPKWYYHLLFGPCAFFATFVVDFLRIKNNEK